MRGFARAAARRLPSSVRPQAVQQPDPMPLLARARYSLYLAVVISAIVMLVVAIASADVVGLLPIGVFDALFSPFFFPIVYVVSYVLAPWLARRFPVVRPYDTSS